MLLPAPSVILATIYPGDYRQLAITGHSQCKKHDTIAGMCLIIKKPYITSSFLALFFSFCCFIYIFFEKGKNNKKGKQNMNKIKIKKLSLKTKIKIK